MTEHPMAQPWLQWRKFDGLRMETNSEFVLVLMPKRGPCGHVQGCKIKNGKPFVIGGIFAWDFREQPTHWAEIPDLPND